MKHFYKKSDYESLEECGVEFKYMQGNNFSTIGSFLENIKPISCDNATKLLSYDNKTSSYDNKTSSCENTTLNSFTLVNGLDINLSPDEVDVAHVGLAGAFGLLIFSNMICCLCCLCRKKKSNKVSIPMA